MPFVLNTNFRNFNLHLIVPNYNLRSKLYCKSRNVDTPYVYFRKYLFSITKALWTRKVSLYRNSKGMFICTGVVPLGEKRKRPLILVHFVKRKIVFFSLYLGDETLTVSCV